MSKPLFITLFVMLQFSELIPQDLSDFKWIKEEPEWYFYYSGLSSTERYAYGRMPDRTIFLESETGEPIKTIENPNKPHFINDDLQFVQLETGNRSINTVDFETLETTAVVQDFKSDITEIAIDEQNRLIYGMTYEGIVIWYLDSGELILEHKYPAIENFIEHSNKNIRLSCDGNSIFISHEIVTATNPSDHNTYSRRNYISRYDVGTFEELNRYQWGDAYTISPDCQDIAFVSRKVNGGDYGVNIYNIESGDSITAINTGCRQIREVAYSKDSRYIGVAATCGNLGLSVWDMESKEVRYERVFGATGISFYRNGSVLSAVHDAIFTFKHGVYTSIDISIESKITIYPNPTNSNFTITGLDSGLYEITLINSLGQTVGNLHNGYIDQNIELDLSLYPIGDYIITARSNQASYESMISIRR